MRSAKGASGRLLVGYQVAAELGAWTYTNREAALGMGEWSVGAAVVRADPFWLESDGPKVLELDFGEKRLRWPAVRADVADTTVAITGVGPPEVH